MDWDLSGGRRRWNGWGGEETDFPLKPKALEFLNQLLNGPGAVLPDASLASVMAQVPESRLPSHPLVSAGAETRIRHARGQSFPDWLAMRSGDFGRFPDGVALPATSEEVREVLQWALGQRFTVILYGGGTSVAGHVNVPACTGAGADPLPGTDEPPAGAGPAKPNRNLRRGHSRPGA